MKFGTRLIGLVMLACLLAMSMTAQDKTTVKGMIKNRTGDTLVVQTDSGDKNVTLKEDTYVKDDTGLFGLDKEMGPTVLIPGLKVKVEGVPDEQGRVVAQRITVDGDDLETSEMIQAGLHPTAEQVAANVQRLEAHQQQLQTHKQGIESNKQDIAANRQKIESTIKDVQAQEERFSRLDDFDVKGQTTVKFSTGSAATSAADKQQLKQLAQTATQTNGYLVEVIGFADSTGSPAINTKLSEDRAKAVVTYLTQECAIPVRRIMAPGAMGEYGPAASNESKTGRAENRRVEVKVLVNKGIAPSS